MLITIILLYLLAGIGICSCLEPNPTFNQTDKFLLDLIGITLWPIILIGLFLFNERN